MNALTKTFVVLTTMLAVLLVALVVPFVANTENYKAQLDKLSAQVQVGKANLSMLQSEIATLQDKQSQQIKDLKGMNQTLTVQLTEVTSKLRDAENGRDAERATRVGLEANIGRLTAANNQQLQILQALESELKDRRNEMQGQQIRAIQLADRNNELQSQLETLERSFRRNQEKSAELETRAADLESMMARLSPEERARITQTGQTDVAAMPVESDTKITGRITGIQRLEGDTFVKVNIGQADGVKTNMKFLVHRGNQFLATLVITTVDNQEAAGRIQLAQGEIKPGDSVYTGGY